MGTAERKGMDTARVREIANGLRGQAQSLDQVRAEVEQVATSLRTAWRGDDARTFAKDAVRHDDRLYAVATAVREMSRALYEQVSDQDVASAVDDGHGGGPLGPLDQTTEEDGTGIPFSPEVTPPTSSWWQQVMAQLGLGSPWVPQGLATDPSGDLLISTLYNENNPGEGLLVIQDRDGNVIRTVQLSGSDHYGGVAVHGDNVWVSGDGKVQLYSLSDIQSADDGAQVHPSHSYPVEGSSTVTYHDGQLWTAQFDSDHEMQVYAYDVHEDGSLDTTDVTVPLPFGNDVTVPTTSPDQTLPGVKEMQGIAVNDRYIYLSGSEDRDSTHSVLTRIDRVTGERESIDVPSNMSEGIALRGNDLITTYESGADKYADGREPRHSTTVRHLD